MTTAGTSTLTMKPHVGNKNFKDSGRNCERQTHTFLMISYEIPREMLPQKERIVQVNVRILVDEVKIVSVLEIPEVPEGEFLIMYRSRVNTMSGGACSSQLILG